MCAWRIPSLLAMALISGCAVDSPTLPTSPPPPEVRPITQHILPIRQRMDAIRARARLARSGRAPTEQVVRFYDEFGAVRRELVLRDGKVFRRPSTLPANLGVRSLQSFLNSGTGEHGQLLMIPAVRTQAYTDTIGTSILTFSDSLWSDSTVTTASFVRDATDPDFAVLTDTWFALGDADTLTKSLGADVFLVEDGNVVGLEIMGDEWADAVSQFSADTAGMGFYRSAARGAGGSQSALGGSDATDGKIQPHASTTAERLVALIQTYEDICEAELRYYRVAAALDSLVVTYAIVTCVRTTPFPGVAGPPGVLHKPPLPGWARPM